MTPSAKVRLRTASRRDVVSRFALWASAALSAISFHVFQIGPAQNFAATVSSAVRVVLVFWPRLLTSLRAVAYAELVTAGGASGRNCEALSRTNGLTLAHPVKTGAANAGGTGRKWPGLGRATKEGGGGADPTP